MEKEVTNKSKKVVVGLSGGVDSSVSAALLQKAGYDVVGVFIKAWQAPGIPCTWKEDRLSAMRAAAALHIPFDTWDLGTEYKKKVIDEMLESYSKGETPNPDILCNEKIKFGVFAVKAFEKGADFVATGHYARLVLTDDTAQLLEAVDADKDQSYFLARVHASILKRTLFPIGGYKKEDVRALARTFRLPTADRPDSQGLCFMGQLDVKEFLKEYVPHENGAVLSLQGNVIGSHDGVSLYTLGERHGFTVTDGNMRKTPLYVVEKRMETNELVVAETSEKTETDSLSVRDLHELESGALTSGQYDVRFRYRQKRVPAMLERDGSLPHVRFSSPVANAAFGQTIAFYRDSRCIGSGIITKGHV